MGNRGKGKGERGKEVGINSQLLTLYSLARITAIIGNILDSNVSIFVQPFIE
jgi:hypothetical protein